MAALAGLWQKWLRLLGCGYLPPVPATELLRLGKVPGPAFHYTEYPAEKGYFHACWEPAYQDQAMREWLFRQRLD